MQNRTLILAAIFAVAVLFSQPSSADVQRPNVIIVLADDMGYGDVSACNPQSKIPTPHIDRLAREGMMFTDGHSSSGVCTSMGSARHSICSPTYGSTVACRRRLPARLRLSTAPDRPARILRRSTCSLELPAVRSNTSPSGLPTRRRATPSLLTSRWPRPIRPSCLCPNSRARAVSIPTPISFCRSTVTWDTSSTRSIGTVSPTTRSSSSPRTTVARLPRK